MTQETVTTPTMLLKNRYNVFQIAIPFMVNNQLQLFTEKFAQLQSGMPQLKTKFEIDEIREHNYFLVSVWDADLDRYWNKEQMTPILEYIQANS